MSRLIGYLLGFFSPSGVLITFITHLVSKYGLKLLFVPIFAVVLTMLFYLFHDVFYNIFWLPDYIIIFLNDLFYIINDLYDNNMFFNVAIDVLRSIGFFEAFYDFFFDFKLFLILFLTLFISYVMFYFAKFIFYLISKISQFITS